MLKTFRIAAILVALQSPAWAQTRTLTVAGYAGSLETTLRAELIPVFEKKFGVRVDYIPGNTKETLDRLEFGTRSIDVAIADDWAISRAIHDGRCQPIEGLPTDDLYAAARFKDDRAVALGLAGLGFMYNTKYFKQKGWMPPQAWNDLKDPKFSKLIVIPPITDPYGLETLVMLARANGGGEGNIDPGFKALEESIRSNVLAFEPSLERIWTLFNRGHAEIVVWSSGRAQYYAGGSDFVGFAYPRDGAPAALAAACPAAGPAGNSLASAFVNAMLQPRLQRLFFRDYGYAPVGKSVTVPVGPTAIAPLGNRASSLVALDWDTINAHRDEWIARWKREIGQ